LYIIPHIQEIGKRSAKNFRKNDFKIMKKPQAEKKPAAFFKRDELTDGKSICHGKCQSLFYI